MARAMSSLPVPVSPKISTVDSVGATTSTCFSAAVRAALAPTISSKLCVAVFPFGCRAISIARNRLLDCVQQILTVYGFGEKLECPRLYGAHRCRDISMARDKNNGYFNTRFGQLSLQVKAA